MRLAQSSARTPTEKDRWVGDARLPAYGDRFHADRGSRGFAGRITRGQSRQACSTCSLTSVSMGVEEAGAGVPTLPHPTVAGGVSPLTVGKEMLCSAQLARLV